MRAFCPVEKLINELTNLAEYVIINMLVENKMCWLVNVS